jgi:8-oxo-dGTP diphosphatase
MPPSEYLRQIRSKIGNDLLFFPGVIAVVINEAGEVLLQHRSDTGKWCLIGGIMDPGEEPADTTIREVLEEAGVLVTINRLVGIYSEPDSLVNYPNGDQMMFMTIVFACRPISGEAHVNDDESLEVRYFPLDNLPPLYPPRLYTYLEQTLQNDPKTYFKLDSRKAAH